MATKKLKTAEITLIGCGDEAVTLTATDTVAEPNAKYALDAFSVENMMHFKVVDEEESEGNVVEIVSEYFVPFHAVDHIVVTETEAEVADKPSPYGC